MRLDSSLATRVVEELADSGVLRSERSVLLSLSGVRDRLGEGWRARRERVYDQLERQADKLLMPSDLLMRVGETGYLLTSPEPDPHHSRTLAVRLSRDLCTFLFGEASEDDIDIQIVRDLEEGALVCRPASDDELTVSFGRLAPARSRRAAPTSADIEAVGVWPAALPPDRVLHTPVITPAGQGLKVEHRALPLVDLQRRASAGAAVSVTVDDELRDILTAEEVGRLSSATLEQIDLAALDMAEQILTETRDAGGALIVVAPIALGTLIGSRGRLALLNRIRGSRSGLAAALILEVNGLRDGFLPSRLREATALVRPFCRGMYVSIPPVRALAEALRGAGLRGASVTARELAAAARRDPDPRRLRDSATVVGPELMISGLRTPKALEMARQIGATYGVPDPNYRG